MRCRVLRAVVHHISGDIDLTRLRGDELIQCIGHYFLPSASTGDGAPGASGFAFSSPGSTYFAPSQGLRKSKLRKSCASRSEEHTSELQSLMRISYAVFCLKKKNKKYTSTAKYQPNKFTYNKTTEKSQ